MQNIMYIQQDESLEGDVLLKLFHSHIALQTTFHLFDMPLNTIKIQLAKTGLTINRQKNEDSAQALYIHIVILISLLKKSNYRK